MGIEEDIKKNKEDIKKLEARFDVANEAQMAILQKIAEKVLGKPDIPDVAEPAQEKKKEKKPKKTIQETLPFDGIGSENDLGVPGAKAPGGKKPVCNCPGEIVEQKGVYVKQFGSKTTYEKLSPQEAARKRKERNVNEKGERIVQLPFGVKQMERYDFAMPPVNEYWKKKGLADAAEYGPGDRMESLKPSPGGKLLGNAIIEMVRAGWRARTISGLVVYNAVAKYARGPRGIKACREYTDYMDAYLKDGKPAKRAKAVKRDGVTAVIGRHLKQTTAHLRSVGVLVEGRRWDSKIKDKTKAKQTKPHAVWTFGGKGDE